MSEQHRTEIATLAGGCFWCLEAVFKEVKGVISVIPGYTGGKTENPTYEEVSTGKTGHAEAVQITYDPDVISYPEILDIFFSIHDPTTLNRQGNDVGMQYRSAIFYHNEQQAKYANALILHLNREKIWVHGIVTQVVPFEKFYSAEEYHRDYFSKHPDQGYCQVVISPKLAKFRKEWGTSLKKQSS
jgi:peptide-methionine (S)-S-oxide reductase